MALLNRIEELIDDIAITAPVLDKTLFHNYFAKYKVKMLNFMTWHSVQQYLILRRCYRRQHIIFFLKEPRVCNVCPRV